MKINSLEFLETVLIGVIGFIMIKSILGLWRN